MNPIVVGKILSNQACSGAMSQSSDQSFVHLHVHTHFSLLDGAIKTEDLCKKCVEFGMPAVALTDHGNLFGAVEFQENAQRAGIKSILGCEIYLAPFARDSRKEMPGRKRATHMTLLAENDEGWHNLVKLVTRGHLEGMWYGHPRVDRNDLAEFSKGIIATSGCIGGPVNEWLLRGDYDKARATMAELRDIFGQENFFVELQNHGLEEQRRTMPDLIKIARELNLPLVAANDAHFLVKEDHEMHDVLICIGTGKKIYEEKRMRYSPELYLKSPQEMRLLFADLPEACDNTLRIAERCNVKLHLDSTSSEKYPKFDIPGGLTREEYFGQVCLKGLVKRYGQERVDNDPELLTRLNYEIGIINQLGFSSYFLITADFINWARDNGIAVGPGRGSAAGSIVAYSMGITNICPLRFGLLFERFLNPERVSPPDVDIDFCVKRRQDVIQYVREKYGERCVSNICTFGTMGAKMAIKDVGRVMDLGYKHVDDIAKQIDPKPKNTLKKEWENNPELRTLIESNEENTRLWQTAMKLEGLCRNIGVHAAGVVIGDCDLDTHVPLTRDKDGGVVAQCDMHAITEVGLLKMDFLGLKNLTVIQEAEYYIRQRIPDFHVESVPLDDAKTFQLLNRGATMGVFQLESGGMVKTCRKYGMERIEDIIDLLALYRPGAMQFMDEMIAVKKGEQKVVYEHPLLEKICGDTYGVMIYQEQVQNAAKLLAGYTLGGADLLRRAMGKKKPEEMAKQKAIFIKGAKEVNGISEELSSKIFDKIEKFAGYGFNKSHSACYGHISYWTAYLKANFPVEFMSALLTNESTNTEKIGIFALECRHLGIELLPPHINKSILGFKPEVQENGRVGVRYGLAAIKNVGEGVMEAAVAEREANGEFKSLQDFCNRLDSRLVNKRILEALIRSGAFDFTRDFRSRLVEKIDLVLSSASVLRKDQSMGQSTMFDLFGMNDNSPSETDDSSAVLEEWDIEKRMADEKELLGFYLTAHPLDAYRQYLDREEYNKLGMLDDIELNEEEYESAPQQINPYSSENRPRRRRQASYLFAGMIRSIQIKTTKSNNDKFAILVMEDLTGSAEIVIWPRSFSELQEAGTTIEAGMLFEMKCNIKQDETQARSLALATTKSVKPIRLHSSSAAYKKDYLELNMTTTRHDRIDIERIAEILKKYPGKEKVILTIKDGLGQRAQIELGERFRVKRQVEMMRDLKPFLGQEI